MGDMMKRICIIVALCAMLLLICVLPDSSADEAGWSAKASPDFVFNGDVVELTVTGVPHQYAFVKVMLGNETLDDLLLILNDMGMAKQNWTVPILADTGTYTFLVVSGGFNVTSASVSVVFDDVTYLAYQVKLLQEQNDKLQDMVLANSKETQDVQERLFWIWAASTMVMACGVVCIFITYLYYTDEMRRKMENWKYKDGLKGRMSRFYKTFIDPDMDGLMVRPWPTLFAERRREKNKLDGGKVQPVVIMPDAGSPGGFREYRLDVDDRSVVDDEPEAENDVDAPKEKRTPAIVLWVRGIGDRRTKRKASRKAKELDDMKMKIRAMEGDVAPKVTTPEAVEDVKVATPPEPPTEAVEAPTPPKKVRTPTAAPKKRSAPRKKAERPKEAEI